MSNLSLESLQYGAEVGDLGVDAVRAACRELLALREAAKTPYAITTEAEMLHVRHGSNGYIMNVSRIGDFSDAIPLYVAPQLPVWFGVDWAAPQMPAVPEGSVMVPREATAEMISSGISDHYDRSKIQIHERPAAGPMECAYAAMIAAAPKPE